MKANATDAVKTLTEPLVDALGAARDHPGFSAEAIAAIDTARRADAWRRTAGLLPPHPPKGTP